VLVGSVNVATPDNEWPPMFPVKDCGGFPVVSPLFTAGVQVMVAVPLPADRAADASLKANMPTITTATTTTAATGPMIKDRRWLFRGTA
jgi:hypothetical protein